MAEGLSRVEQVRALRDDPIAERERYGQARPGAGTLGPVNLPTARSRHLVTVAAFALALTSCGSDKPAPTPSSQPTQAATAAPSTPAADKATVHACADAKDSTTGDAIGDEHAQSARTWAALSDVPTLREIAAKYARGTESEGIEMAHLYSAATSIYTWCLQHGLGGLS